jgi:hypothetical protein
MALALVAEKIQIKGRQQETDPLVRKGEEKVAIPIVLERNWIVDRNRCQDRLTTLLNRNPVLERRRWDHQHHLNQEVPYLSGNLYLELKVVQEIVPLIQDQLIHQSREERTLTQVLPPPLQTQSGKLHLQDQSTTELNVPYQTYANK